MIILTGNEANVTSPLSATVTNIALVGGNWRVTTSTAHHFGDRDTVRMIFTASAVNYDFSVQVAIVDATHFDLISPPVGTYTGGTGTAVDMALTPQIQVPTDGDTFSLQISGMLSAIQALCDRTQYLKIIGASPTMVTVTVNATGAIPFPAFVPFAIIEGCGGGGGGGGGAGGSVTTTNSPGGGGGGGGARLGRTIITPLQGHVYNATIGAGGVRGAGGPVNTPGVDGGDGGDTTIDFDGVTILATFRGAMGGTRASAAPAHTSNMWRRAPGGRSIRSLNTSNWKGTSRYIFNDTASLQSPSLTVGDAFGGDGMNYEENVAMTPNTASNGGYENPDGRFAPGSGGAYGTPSGGYPGAGSGGGGGAGPYGAGTNGGFGGNATGGIGTIGGSGADAASNTGAGGGGGGGGGPGPVDGNSGGSGGAGGSGKVVVRYFLPGGVT